MAKRPMAEADLARLFRGQVDTVYRYCWMRLGELEADDVTSEVFAVAWEKGGEIPPAARRAWLLGVARKLVANRLRSRKKHWALISRYGVEHARQAPDPAATVVAAAGLRSALSKLRPADQEVLVLAAMSDLSQVQLGQVLGCTSKAAGVRLSRARARLSQELKQQNEPRRTTAVRVRLEQAS